MYRDTSGSVFRYVSAELDAYEGKDAVKLPFYLLAFSGPQQSNLTNGVN